MSINVGVIGTGNIGQDHIRRITQADACVEAQKTGKIVKIELGSRPALYHSTVI